MPSPKRNSKIGTRKSAPLSSVAAFLDTLAPPHLAESWDNVGLLSGLPDSPVRRVLLTIDLTPAVYDEALAARTDLLVAYHPPIFKALKSLRITGRDAPNLAIQLASHGVWIYSPHTALDTAPNGTNDVLAAKVGAAITGSFVHAAGQGSYLKLVTFIPQQAVEKVAEAVFEAGAGRVGVKAKYTRCSFRTPGLGTFQGDASTHPNVGAAGVYERAPEIRFETILSAGQAPAVVAALRAAHPYEEPAFDLLKMETPPESVGLGRFAVLPKAMRLAAFARHCAQALRLPNACLLYTSPSPRA